jgi:flagellar biosynthesis protein FlhG
LAIWLARRGNKVLLIDGDFSMANLDILFGVRAPRTIFDVIQGDAELKDILIEVEPNITLIPGGSGIRELNKLSDMERRGLLDQVSQIPTAYDFLIIDTAPGIDDNVLHLNSAVNEINVVVTPDPASIADSYALIKVLNQSYKETKFSVICNMVRDEHEGLALFKRLSDVASKFLCVSLDYKGSIPSDLNLRNATKSQQLIMKVNAQTPSSLAIREVAQKLRQINNIDRSKGGIQFFWEQVFAQPHVLRG